MNQLSTKRAIIIGSILITTAIMFNLFSPSDRKTSIDADSFITKSAAQKGSVVLDVRTKVEYESGHLPGALNIDITSDLFAQTVSSLEKDLPYFIYCRSGNRSSQAVSFMKKIGFKEVYDLEGGLMNNEEKLTLIRG
jgi:rhodanese-related sulfurtransferase